MADLILYAGLSIVIVGLIWAGTYGLLVLFAHSARGCPRCHSPVVRIKRHPQDRKLGYLAPRIRRFSCRMCRWEGLLIAPRSEKSRARTQSPE